MVESHLVFGRQDLKDGMTLADLTYGQSITDGCIGWEDSLSILENLAQGVRDRRIKPPSRRPSFVTRLAARAHRLAPGLG